VLCVRRQSTISRQNADRQVLEQRIVDTEALRAAADKERVAVQAEVMRVQTALSLAQMEKQNSDGQRETLQWQLKQQEETLQVRAVESEARADSDYFYCDCDCDRDGGRGRYCERVLAGS
jgi:hypothetical protein